MSPFVLKKTSLVDSELKPLLLPIDKDFLNQKLNLNNLKQHIEEFKKLSKFVKLITNNTE